MVVEGERTQNYRKPELISFCAQGTAFHPLKFLSWYPDLVNKLGRRIIFLKKKSKIKPDTMQIYGEMKYVFHLKGIHQ